MPRPEFCDEQRQAVMDFPPVMWMPDETKLAYSRWLRRSSSLNRYIRLTFSGAASFSTTA